MCEAHFAAKKAMAMAEECMLPPPPPPNFVNTAFLNAIMNRVGERTFFPVCWLVKDSDTENKRYLHAGIHYDSLI